VIRVELEQTGRPAEHLPVDRQVDHRRQQAVGIHPDPELSVVQHPVVAHPYRPVLPAPAPRGPPQGRGRHPAGQATIGQVLARSPPGLLARAGIEDHHLGTGGGRGVGHGPPLALPQGRHRGRHEPLQVLGHPGVGGLGFLVDPGDRAPRQDVVELMEEHGGPRIGQGPVGILGARVDRGGGCPQLGLAQQVLAAPVTGLGAGLARVGAPMLLEVELPRPHRRIGVLGLGRPEERRGGLDRHPGRALEVPQAVGPPPPSPWPKGTRDLVARPLSAKFATAWLSSEGTRVAP
jgi:hypothetical protein